MLKISVSDRTLRSPIMLKLLGFTVDDEGYLTRFKTGQRIVDSDGQEIELSDFGGVTNGSEIVFKNNLVSLVKIFEKRQEQRC